MRVLTIKEWVRLYESEWRRPLAHLPKAERAKLVRGCKGKAIYDSPEEAAAVVATLPLRPGYLVGAYDCPVCGSIHVGNRRHLHWDTAHLAAVEGDTKVAPKVAQWQNGGEVCKGVTC